MVIPKALRDRLGIRPGDEVEMTLDADAVRVVPLQDDASLRGQFARLGLTSEIQAEHVAELKRDRLP